MRAGRGLSVVSKGRRESGSEAGYGANPLQHMASVS